MTALEYKSVSTVASHVEGLIAKGYLTRRDNSPRSLDIATVSPAAAPSAVAVEGAESVVAVGEAKLAELEDKDRVTVLQALALLGFKEEAVRLGEKYETR